MQLLRADICGDEQVSGASAALAPADALLIKPD
jgi:hypothetical protein